MLSPVTMILRGYNLNEVTLVAEVLLQSKYVRNMEITMNTEGAIDIIKNISSRYGDKLNIGAGTVQVYEELVKAVDAGATFILSPRKMDKKMMEFCKIHEIMAIPGSFTASEIAESYYQGASAVKVFPANEVSLGYARKIKEPMGPIPLMAVGGINKDNVAEAFASGYDYVGTAGGLFNKVDIQRGDKEAMLKSLKLFEEAIDSAK